MNQYQSISEDISSLTKESQTKQSPLYSIRPIKIGRNNTTSTSAVIFPFFTTLRSVDCSEVNLGSSNAPGKTFKNLNYTCSWPSHDIVMQDFSLRWDCMVSEEQRDCACWSETWEYNDCGPFTEAIEGKSNWLWLRLQSLWSTEGFTHSDQVVQVNIWQLGRTLSATLIEIFNRMSFHICPEWTL